MMSIVLDDIGFETGSVGDVISSSNDDAMNEDTQCPVSAPPSIPDATLQRSKRTNVNQGAENKESDVTLQWSKRTN
eukprot:1732270-Ditylum_brightwellii.AAC.1